LCKQPDLALFSAGAAASLKWAPKFVDGGCKVIDNSSAWRMEPYIKLVVPEVNGDVLGQKDTLIANPNCSTMQLVMVLNPLHQAFKIKRVVVSTYQSITGTGVAAARQLENERAGISGEMAYPYPIDKNCLPHCDSFLENGYTKEEMKLTNETKKILGDDSVSVVATAVRVPVVGGHSESVNIEFANAFDVTDSSQDVTPNARHCSSRQPDNQHLSHAAVCAKQGCGFCGQNKGRFYTAQYPKHVDCYR
jgi:aspartate-semialdehyde dehydrogenase